MSERTQRMAMEKVEAPRLHASISINLTGQPSASTSPIPHPDEWPVVRLADITLKIGSGATPRGGSENYLPERLNFALIRSQNVFDRHFDCAGLAFISDEQVQGLQSVIVQPNDLLLNITGDGITFARCCVVPEDVLPACVNQHVSIIRVDPRLADPGYVLAYLTHLSVKAYIESFNAGGSRRAITKGHIESFLLPLPPLPEQHKIALILGTLDDKIELNRKMNETLEAMARALFKSWFVDFDPVGAKAEGRDTGLPAHITALFPDSFEDSELGEIPMEWRATTLGVETEQHGGRIQTGPFGSQLHASDYSAEGVPVVMPQDIANRRVSTARIARINELDAQRLARHRLETGDIIYSRRGDVERHAQISAREVGWLCGTGCLLVRMGPQWPTSMFMSLSLDRPESRAWITQHAIGATMPNLNTGILSAIPLVVPPTVSCGHSPGLRDPSNRVFLRGMRKPIVSRCFVTPFCRNSSPANCGSRKLITWWRHTSDGTRRSALQHE